MKDLHITKGTKGSNAMAEYQASIGTAPGPKPTNNGVSLTTGYKKMAATDSYKCPSADAQSRNR